MSAKWSHEKWSFRIRCVKLKQSGNINFPAVLFLRDLFRKQETTMFSTGNRPAGYVQRRRRFQIFKRCLETTKKASLESGQTYLGIKGLDIDTE